MSSSEDRTHNQSVLQSHFVPLRHDWLLTIYYLLNTIFIITLFLSLFFNFTCIPHEAEVSKKNQLLRNFIPN